MGGNQITHAGSTSRRRVFALPGGCATLAVGTAERSGVAQERRKPVENIKLSGVNGLGKKHFAGERATTERTQSGLHRGRGIGARMGTEHLLARVIGRR